MDFSIQRIQWNNYNKILRCVFIKIRNTLQQSFDGNMLLPANAHYKKHRLNIRIRFN